MRPPLEEQEPGVYVRSNRPDQELDFLWDKDRKKHPENDRFHLGFFAAGFVLGAVVSAVVCVLLYSGGSLFPSSKGEAPTIVEEEVLSPEDLKKNLQSASPESAKEEGFNLMFFAKEKPKAEDKKAVTDAKARMYAVQSGDTLGSIAIKFYESSSPEMIRKIQRANKMSDADTLSLGQKLVIPPKTY